MAATDWYQQSLTPHDVIEVNIRLGFVTSADHMQALVQAYDPMTRIQIAQFSRPHVRLPEWQHALAWATEKATELVLDHVPTF